MAAGATGTPTSNFSIPKYATSADAPNGTGFNSAMDAIDLALKGINDAKVEVVGTPADGDAIVWDAGTSHWIPGSSGTPGVIPVQLLNSSDTNSFWTVTAIGGGAGFGHWELVKDVTGLIYGQVLVPAGVTAATARFVIAANATSGVTRLSLFASATAAAEGLLPSTWNLGNPLTAQDITVPGTAYLRKDVTFSLTGLAGADLVTIALQHEGAHANDTLAVNTLLFGAWLEPA